MCKHLLLLFITKLYAWKDICNQTVFVANIFFTIQFNPKKYPSTLQTFNPFSTNVPLLYPLKTSKNRRFSDVFRGYRSGTLVENDLIKLNKQPLIARFGQLYKILTIQKFSRKIYLPDTFKLFEFFIFLIWAQV